jgi:SEC-C motif-containing protein
MRSRYAAFAKNERAYLWRTLHAEHVDRQHAEADVLRALGDAARSSKYMGVVILDTRPPDDEGIARVLFLAKVFEKGRDKSFVELSDFAHDGEGWRYSRGEPVMVSGLRLAPEQLTIDAFPTAASGTR